MEDFQHDVTALRKKIEELEADKADRDSVTYHQLADLEDKLEKAEKDAAHFKKFAQSRILSAKPGDIFVIDNHEFIQAYTHEFMAMAKFNQCMFVVLPTNGMDHIIKMSDQDLARLRLKKIDQ